MMAMAVSKIGTPAAMMGTNRETKNAERATAIRETMPSAKPKSSAPESPMNILAGWMFDFKKPMHAPTITKLASAAPGRQVSTARMPIVAAVMAVMPAASPSRPSMRLMMFAKATI